MIMNDNVIIKAIDCMVLLLFFFFNLIYSNIFIKVVIHCHTVLVYVMGRQQSAEMLWCSYRMYRMK